MEKTWEGEDLPRAAYPEEAGVSTAELTAFVRDLEEIHIANHSFMILRHGVVAAEAFVPPFNLPGHAGKGRVPGVQAEKAGRKLPEADRAPSDDDDERP